MPAFLLSLLRDGELFVVFTAAPVSLKLIVSFVIIYGLLTKREVKMAGYWPSSFFASLCTETESRSINSPKNNEANIQLS